MMTLVSSLSNSGLLRPISSSGLLPLASKVTQQPLQQTQTSATLAVAQLSLDSYTPSETIPSNTASNKQFATANASTSASIASASTASMNTAASTAKAGSVYLTTGTAISAAYVPQSISEVVANSVTPEQKAWGTLTRSLASGDISSTQSALAAYNQALPSSTLYMSSQTTPSAQFLNDLTNVGSALSAGNVAQAQASFASAQLDHPASVAEAMSAAKSTLSADLTQAVQGLEGTSDLSGLNTDKLSQDSANLASLNRENFANISNTLAAQGYSSSDVSKYAGFLTAGEDAINASAVLSDGTKFSIETYTNYVTNESISGGTDTHTTISGNSANYSTETSSISNVAIDEHAYAITSVAVGMVTSGGDYTTLIHDRMTASADSSAFVQASSTTESSVHTNTGNASSPNSVQLGDVSTSGSVFIDDAGRSNDTISLLVSAPTQVSDLSNNSGSANVLVRSGTYASYAPNVINDIGAQGNSVTYLVRSREGQSDPVGIPNSSVESSTSTVIDSTSGYFGSSIQNVSAATNRDSYGSMEQRVGSESQGMYAGDTSGVSTQTTITLNNLSNNPVTMANSILNSVLYNPSYNLSNQEKSLLSNVLEGGGFGNSAGFSVSSSVGYSVSSSSVNFIA